MEEKRGERERERKIGGGHLRSAGLFPHRMHFKTNEPLYFGPSRFSTSESSENSRRVFFARLLAPSVQFTRNLSHFFTEVEIYRRIACGTLVPIGYFVDLEALGKIEFVRGCS